MNNVCVLHTVYVGMYRAVDREIFTKFCMFDFRHLASICIVGKRLYNVCFLQESVSSIGCLLGEFLVLHATIYVQSTVHSH